MLAVAGVARADAPSFTIMDRQDDVSRAGTEASYVFPGNTGSTRVFRFDLHGVFLDPDNGIGGYVQVPFSYVTGVVHGGSSSTNASGAGDLELGGIYMATLQPNAKLVLHGGLTLPTASNDNGGTANLLASFARLDDFYLVLPRAFSLRLGASPIIESGALFARLDVGLDVNLSADATTPGSTTADTVVRLNAGVGWHQDHVAVSVEVVNLHGAATAIANSNGGWVDVAALSVRLLLGEASPYFAVTFPLDHDSSSGMNAAVTAGVEARLR